MVVDVARMLPEWFIERRPGKHSSGCHCRKRRLGDGSFVKEVVKADWTPMKVTFWKQVGSASRDVRKHFTGVSAPHSDM
jgi:hypothetical protein